MRSVIKFVTYSVDRFLNSVAYMSFFLLNHCDFMGMLLLVYCFGNYFPPKAVFFLLLLLFAAMHYFLSVNSFFLLHAFVPKFVF